MAESWVAGLVIPCPAVGPGLLGDGRLSATCMPFATEKIQKKLSSALANFSFNTNALHAFPNASQGVGLALQKTVGFQEPEVSSQDDDRAHRLAENFELRVCPATRIRGADSGSRRLGNRGQEGGLADGFGQVRIAARRQAARHVFADGVRG